MPVTGDTLVRLIEGTDVPISSLVDSPIDSRLFGVKDPQVPVAVAGATLAGLIVATRARGARITRRAEPVTTITFKGYRSFRKDSASTEPFGSDTPFGGDLGGPKADVRQLRCARAQLVMLIDGRWKTAEKLRPGERVRPLVTDIAPGTNGDILPIPDGAGRISTSSLRFPVLQVETNITSGVEDMWDLECPFTGNYAVSAKVFVYALATALR